MTGFNPKATKFGICLIVPFNYLVQSPKSGLRNIREK
jgi:hypothetical protein